MTHMYFSQGPENIYVMENLSAYLTTIFEREQNKLRNFNWLFQPELIVLQWRQQYPKKTLSQSIWTKIYSSYRQAENRLQK